MQVRALNDRDPLNLSALQLTQPSPKKERPTIDWDNFDLDQIPEDLIKKVGDLDKLVPSSKLDKFENVVLDPWIFTEQKEKNEIVEMTMPIRRFETPMDSEKMPLP